MGGKWQLSKQIVPLIPSHDCYVEPFAGAAWVLFRKPPSAAEIINDINREIVTLYRVIQHHLDEFVRYFRWVLCSRDEFERWLLVSPDTLTDIQRATRFYHIQKLSFAGRIEGPTFGTATTRPPRLNLLRIEEDLSAAHLRLSRVLVENRPYYDLISSYDRPHTFFYIDPPYWGCEDYYGKAIFSRADFNRLADQLQRIQGQFILSLNDHPEVREIFKSFAIRAVQCTYSCSRSSRRQANELLISNFDLSPA
jgi:DNA adenine methylase